MGEKITMGKELNPSIWKQTGTFSPAHWKPGTFVSFTTFSSYSCKVQICTGHGMNLEHDHIQTPWNHSSLKISGPYVKKVT